MPIGKINAILYAAKFTACEAENRNHCYILATFSQNPTLISKLTTS